MKQGQSHSYVDHAAEVGKGVNEQGENEDGTEGKKNHLKILSKRQDKKTKRHTIFQKCELPFKHILLKLNTNGGSSE